MEIINRKENMEVGTICFEVRILMKKKRKKIDNYLDLDPTILFWKKTKIILDTFLYRESKTECIDLITLNNCKEFFTVYLS